MTSPLAAPPSSAAAQVAAAAIAKAGARRDAASPRTPPREVLTFRLGDESYGIDILRVQEIRKYEAPTRIATAAPALKGVVDLRGDIVPVFDLRLKLGCAAAEVSATTVVIVATLGPHVVGAVVDAVSDVVALPAGAVRPAPALPPGSAADVITGLASLADRMVILLDLDALLATDAALDPATLAGLAATASAGD